MNLRLQEIAASDIPVGPLADPVTFYKARTGYIVHLDRSCSSTHTVLYGHHVSPLELGDLKTCDKCVKRLPAPLHNYHAVILMIMWLTSATDAYAANENPAWTDVARVQRGITRVEQGANKLGPTLLDETAEEALTAARRALAEHPPVGGDTSILTRCAVAAVARAHDGAPLPDELAEPVALRAPNHTKVMLTREMWNAYRGAVHSGADLDDARDAARSSAIRMCGTAPARLDQVPDVNLDDAPAGVTLRSWAAELWSVERDREINEICDHWEQLVLTEADDAQQRTPVLVGIPDTDSQHAAHAALVAPYPTVRSTDGKRSIVKVPAAVAELLQERPWTGQNGLGRGTAATSANTCDAADGDDEILATVLALWVSSSDISFTDAVDAARLLEANVTTAPTAA